MSKGREFSQAMTSPLRVPAPDPQAGSVGGQAAAFLRLQQLRMHAPLFEQQLVLLQHDLAQFELGLNLLRQGFQGQHLQCRQPIGTRRRIEHAQGTERDTVAGFQQFARIEAQAGTARHQRIAFETVIGGGVGHHHSLVFQQDEFADRIVQRHLPHAQADFGFEPLAMGIDQVDGDDGRVEQLAGQAHDIVEGRFRGGIEDAIRAQRGEAFGFSPVGARTRF